MSRGIETEANKDQGKGLSDQELGARLGAIRSGVSRTENQKQG